MIQNNIYIFGAGTNGEQCLMNCRKHGIEVAAFLDNYTDKVLFHSIPVMRPEGADRLTPVVVTSPHYCVDITLQLEWLGFVRVLNLSQFNSEIHVEPMWANDLTVHRPEYEATRGMLADCRSQAVFDACIKFRTTLDAVWLAAVRSPAQDQWFDPEFFRPGPHVFVDGGAYDGDTAQEFINRCPEYELAYLFEPSKDLWKKAKQRFENESSVAVLNAGLSDSPGAGHLQNAGLPSGKIGLEGDMVPLVSLDPIAMRTPTFIKLDVEGCELAALQGARCIITEHKPLLAVALYHKPEDIWELPQLISRMRPDYKFHLRHYTQFYHETVLYAV